MALTIDATVGGADANSFGTLNEADAYMESRLNASAWESDASTDDKNRALAEATRELSSLPWQGVRASDTQALAWPRELVRDPDDPSHNYFDRDEIPARVKRATFELALAFIKAGTTDIVSIEQDRLVKRTRIDVIETEYVDPQIRPSGLARYPAVMREIAPLLDSSPLTVAVIKG
jgi:hypothetical protein